MTIQMKIIDAINKYDGYIRQDEVDLHYYIHLNLPDIGKCCYLWYNPFSHIIGEDYPDDIENHMLYSNIRIKF